MANFCPDCGAALGELPRTPEAEDAAVKIARMECERDIEIARINAGVARRELDTAETIAETEAEADVVSAGAEVAVAMAMAGQQDQADAPAVEVIDAQEGGDAEVVDDTAAPPVLEATEGSQPPEPPNTRGIGMWGG